MSGIQIISEGTRRDVMLPNSAGFQRSLWSLHSCAWGGESGRLVPAGRRSPGKHGAARGRPSSRIQEHQSSSPSPTEQEGLGAGHQESGRTWPISRFAPALMFRVPGHTWSLSHPSPASRRLHSATPWRDDLAEGVGRTSLICSNILLIHYNLQFFAPGQGMPKGGSISPFHR